MLKTVQYCDTEVGMCFQYSANCITYLTSLSVKRLVRFRWQFNVQSLCRGPGQGNDKRVLCVCVCVGVCACLCVFVWTATAGAEQQEAVSALPLQSVTVEQLV